MRGNWRAVMPMYEFKCKSCGNVHDELLTVAEFKGKRHRCPKCNGRDKAVLCPPAIHMRYSLMHPRHMRGQRTR